MSKRKRKQLDLQGREVKSGDHQRQKRRKKVARHTYAWWWLSGIVAICLVCIGIFIVLSNNEKAVGVVGANDQTVLTSVTTVTSKTLNEVGTGGLEKLITPIHGQPLLPGPHGKPEVFYYGAEFCPYCAANRWSLVIALSHFGTFQQLPETLSSSTDAYANTATFTFVKSSYTSSLIDFVPVEAEDRDQKPLQTPTADQQQLLQTFHVTGFPFLDIANQYQAGALYDPSVLANLSQKEIASKLSDANDHVTKNIVGGANYLMAAICVATHNQPATVCTQAPLPALIQSLSPRQSSSVPRTTQMDIVSILDSIVEKRRMEH